MRADAPSAAGMLATDGGLIFTGKLTGEFLALDADTGKTLWQFKASSSVGIRRRRCPALRASQRADRRLVVDVRVDAGVNCVARSLRPI
jgi:outer membrane protein assembly factor BamB